MCMTQYLGLKTLHMTMYEFKWPNLDEQKFFIENPTFYEKSKSGSEFCFGLSSLDIDFRAILRKFSVTKNFSVEIQFFHQKSISIKKICV